MNSRTGLAPQRRDALDTEIHPADTWLPVARVLRPFDPQTPSSNLRQGRWPRSEGKPTFFSWSDEPPCPLVLIRARHRVSVTGLPVLPPECQDCQDKSAEARDRDPHRLADKRRPPWSRVQSPGRSGGGTVPSCCRMLRCGGNAVLGASQAHVSPLRNPNDLAQAP